MTLALELMRSVTAIDRSFRIRAGSVALAIVMLSACTQMPSEVGTSRASFAELKSELDVHLAGCTETYGLDPREQSGTGENELAVGEKEWLECAYQGIEEIMVPGTKFPKMYRQLIADSRGMTDLIEQGEITRTQRRIVLQAAIFDIENAEIVFLIRGSVVTNEELDRAKTAELRRAFVGMRTMTMPPSVPRR